MKYSINEHINHYGDTTAITEVWFDIVNNSSEDMLAFAVGIPFNMADDNHYVWITALKTKNGSVIGDWQALIMSQEFWVQPFGMTNQDGTFISAEKYFGMTWDEAVGNEYTSAYVAYPNTRHSSTPGCIPAGTIHGTTDNNSTPQWGNEFAFAIFKFNYI